jgi:ribosomal protein L39E
VLVGVKLYRNACRLSKIPEWLLLVTSKKVQTKLKKQGTEL